MLCMCLTYYVVIHSFIYYKIVHEVHDRQTYSKNNDKNSATAEIACVVLVTHDHVTKDEQTGL